MIITHLKPWHVFDIVLSTVQVLPHLIPRTVKENMYYDHTYFSKKRARHREVGELCTEFVGNH